MILANKQNEIELFINHLEGLSGAVCVKEKDGVIIENAYGFADISNERSNNINTRFGIASGAKLLTGISVCKLVDDGLVSFDSLLKDCLDIAFPNFSPDVTLHHLLTHTSG
ncbi:MAG: serine hydrolase, partial [Turicibacter sp.]